jgi:hypothetical protein
MSLIVHVYNKIVDLVLGIYKEIVLEKSIHLNTVLRHEYLNRFSKKKVK